MYYFDHCASTPPYEQVVRTVGELMTQHYANSGALHRAGSDAMKLVERARASVAAAFGAKPEEVLFTSGGTESNNLAIKGTLEASRKPVKHMITTAIEHASVHTTAKQMERLGVQVTIVKPDGSGRVSAADIAAAIRPETVLVSVMHVNNETGAIQPIEEIGRMLTAYPQIRFHVDGVQAVGKVRLDWASAGVDLYSASSHKFRGPKGAGFLLVRDGVPLEPLLTGGGQEDGLRSGTHNVPGIVATAQALRLTMESMDSRVRRMRELRSRLIGHIGGMPELVLNVGEDDGVYAPHILNVSYPGMRPEVIVHMLEEHGILISTQSACSSKSLKPSRVLSAMGLEEARAAGSIRISLGDEHTEEHIDLLAEALRASIVKLKPLERSSR